ncbi:MAG: lytic transglycosylase domain-containing protein [Kiritimatiellia bacterium]
MKIRLHVLLLLTLPLIPPLRAQGIADYEIDWALVEQITEESHKVAGNLVEKFELPVTLPPVEQLGPAMRLIVQTLEQGSVEDLARLAPFAHLAYGQLAREPRFAPYLHWLSQRLDYFDVARESTRAPAPPPPPRTPTTRPPPPPRPHPGIDTAQTWTDKIKPRPAPVGAKALVPRLKPVFIAEGIPPEWVWLAEVESSFNPAARSPVGALGLYQFMPRTAEHLGLKLTPVDERTHPEKSARAAATYLRHLYGRFDDWSLALAAYNGGEGRVAGLIRKHGRSFDTLAPHLPAETRMYVPKVLATVSERENIDARKLPPPTLRK